MLLCFWYTKPMSVTADEAKVKVLLQPLDPLKRYAVILHGKVHQDRGNTAC